MDNIFTIYKKTKGNVGDKRSVYLHSIETILYFAIIGKYEDSTNFELLHTRDINTPGPFIPVSDYINSLVHLKWDEIGERLIY